MANGLSDTEDAAWRGFLLAHDHLWRIAEAGLARLNVSMAEYTVLSVLADAGPAGMRMSEVAARRLMTSGGFTRLADRLENRGLIERRRSDVDKRSFVAVLTPAGRSLLRRAWRQHLGDLRTHFFGRLNQREVAQLAAIWPKLIADPPGD